MAINHGIKVSEAPTRLTAIQEADSALPVYIGIGAPNQVHKKGAGNNFVTNAFDPVLVGSAEEAYEKVGRPGEGSLLQDAIDLHFTHFGTGPIVLINVLGSDSTHFDKKTSDPVVLEDGRLNLGPYVFAETLTATKSPSGPIAKDTDYLLYYDKGNLILEAVQGQLAQDEALLLTYDHLKPLEVDEEAIIGDAVAKTGLHAVPLVYPRYQRVPCILNAAQALQGGGLASETPSVVSALQAASRDINGVFQAVCYTDVGGDEGDYTEIAQAKIDGAHTDSREFVSWGRVKIGDKIYPGSVVMACVTARVDNEKGGGLPYSSPSNFVIPATQIVADDEALELDLEQASDINDLGVNTFIRWGGAYRTWGNRLASNQLSGDVKDRFVNVRRMLNWVANTAQISFLAQIDNAGNLATIQTILASVNQWLNGLVASGALLKGEAVFNRGENPDQQLIDGKYKIHIYLTIPTPAESVEFVLEFDPSGFAALFE